MSGYMQNNLDTKQLQEDLKALEAKCDQLSNSVQNIATINDNLTQSINDINTKFSQINSNIEQLLNKSNSQESNQGMSGMKNMVNDTMNNMANQNKMGMPIMSSVGNGARKLALGVVGATLTISDMTAEMAMNAKEGLEDMIAEAQYLNRKRKVQNKESTGDLEEEGYPSPS